MTRSAPRSTALVALAALLVASACQKKTEVVVAAPVAPASGAVGQAATGQTGDLPPGHPSLDGMDAMPSGTPPSGMGGEMTPPPHGGTAMSAGDDVGDVEVPKATGKDARTIAELFAERKALSGKTVTVRGKVVKYNPGIMGKNWLHLRDGTGVAGKDNDVTVTTQDDARKGDVVVVQGTVAVDQNIGMGTPYPVIIQDAKVSR
jgi:hypothetical protein